MILEVIYNIFVIFKFFREYCFRTNNYPCIFLRLSMLGHREDFNFRWSTKVAMREQLYSDFLSILYSSRSSPVVSDPHRSHFTPLPTPTSFHCNHLFLPIKGFLNIYVLKFQNVLVGGSNCQGLSFLFVV